MGLYRSGSAYCTQCEAEGFRRITYFLDRPDVLSVYTVRIEADEAEAPVLLSNGNRTAAGAIEGTTPPFRRLARSVSQALLSVRRRSAAISARSTINSSRPRAARCSSAFMSNTARKPSATYAMDALKRSMRWDEEAFGREYDLDVFNIVAVSDFNMGAMENKGLNVFNDKYVLASPETATDTDYAQIEAVIAHEYFHNWTGNRITCRDWFQLCLKEGLTVFRDHEFSADMRSRAVRRIADVRTLRAQQFPEDAGPLAHNVRPETYLEINNFYTATVYEKGAEIIRMLKVLIGAEAFRAGMDLYFARYDGRRRRSKDFIACFAEVSGRDLTQFSAGTRRPARRSSKSTANYDRGDAGADARSRAELQDDARPGQKQPFVIPIELGLVGRDGKIFDLVTGPQDGASAHELATGLIELTMTQRRDAFMRCRSGRSPLCCAAFPRRCSLAYAASEDDLIAPTRTTATASIAGRRRRPMRRGCFCARSSRSAPAWRRFRRALHRRLAPCARRQAPPIPPLPRKS